ncbi:MAG: hypothetical protein IJJ50_01165 [Lachnospiraceae bacterium]|nr:hypothetical protein [Lachnospiraceae bacterium]
MRILTVLDSERVYTEAFAEMLSREKTFPYEVHAFTDRLKMESFLKTKRPAMTLVAEKDFSPEMASWPSDRLVILEEDRKNPECGPFPAIRKYQPFPAVIREILLLADPAVLKTLSEHTASRLQTIGVGSPVRRCGNTLFSLSLARLLADTRSTLFITADPCSGFSRRFREGTQRSLSDLLYDLDTGPEGSAAEGAPDGLDGLTSSIGPLRVLAPFPVMQDAADLFGEALPALFRFCGQYRFRTIVFDAGPLIYDPASLLQMFSRFYMPSLTDPVSAAKMAEFASSLRKTGREDLLEKITPVRLPPEGELLSPDGLIDHIRTLPVSSLAARIIRKDTL